MKRLLAAGALSLLFNVGPALAAEPDKHEAAEQLLVVMNIERNLADIRGQVQAAVAAQVRAMQVPASMKEQSLHFQQQLTDLVFDELSFANMKAAYADIYATNFTADELAGLIAFYKSPAGHAFVDKLPTVTQKMLEVSQSRLQSLQPRIQELQEEFQAQIAKKASDPH